MTTMNDCSLLLKSKSGALRGDASAEPSAECGCCHFDARRWAGLLSADRCCMLLLLQAAAHCDEMNDDDDELLTTTEIEYDSLLVIS